MLRTRTVTYACLNYLRSTRHHLLPSPSTHTTHLALMSTHINTDGGAGDATTWKPNLVFVLGGPGAGKGTQCDMIVKELGFVHLSAGDLLRAERQNPESEVGELIESCIVQGKIVPVKITCGLIEKAMHSLKADNFLIDGFPRNEDNLNGWTEQMAEKVKLKFVLFLKCDKQVCLDRCLNRGAEGSGRSDDNLESLEKRYDTYLTATVPVIKYYEELGLLKTVDAGGSPQEVFSKVKQLFLQL